jgi:hypothetical protein
MIEPLTATQFNRALTITQAQAARHYAVTQNQCYREFWSREPQVILDSINADLQTTLERFSGNTDLGEAVNKQLAKTDFPERCIVELPAGYAFDGNKFIYTPPTPETNV